MLKLSLYSRFETSHPELHHGSALVGSDPHELQPEFEACQMKGTHIGVSELTLFKSYEIGLLRIRPLCTVLFGP